MDVLKEGVTTEDFEHEDWDGSVFRAVVTKFNGVTRVGSKMQNFWYKGISLRSCHRTDIFDDDGNFTGYSHLDQETEVEVDFNADLAEELANWLLEAVKEVRTHKPELR